MFKEEQVQLIKVEASGAKTSFLNRGAGMELFLNVIGIYIDAKLDFFLQLEKNSAFPRAIWACNHPQLWVCHL